MTIAQYFVLITAIQERIIRKASSYIVVTTTYDSNAIFTSSSGDRIPNCTLLTSLTEAFESAVKALVAMFPYDNEYKDSPICSFLVYTSKKLHELVLQNNMVTKTSHLTKITSNVHRHPFHQTTSAASTQSHDTVRKNTLFPMFDPRRCNYIGENTFLVHLSHRYT